MKQIHVYIKFYSRASGIIFLINWFIAVEMIDGSDDTKIISRFKVLFNLIFAKWGIFVVVMELSIKKNSTINIFWNLIKNFYVSIKIDY